MHIVDVICILSTDGYLMCISFLLLLLAYVHIIHILSKHMHIMCTLCAVVLDIFLPNRQCLCHAYIISSTLYISYHIQLSFCTLSTQTYIVNAIWMLSAHVHIICLSSLTLLIYPIIHNLVSTHCLHTHTLSMSSLYCLQMHILCTSHFYCCYLHMSCPCHLHVVCTCTHHLLVIPNTPHIPYYLQLSFCTYCLHTCTLLISSLYCLQMHM